MSQQLRIVVIDDDQGVLKALGLVFQTLGHQASLFNTGGDAVAYLAANPRVDVVVSDLRMPGMDGTEVLRRLRQSHPNIPVVIMSGHATSNDRATLVALGARAVLSKPFAPAELLGLVDVGARSIERKEKVA